MDKVEKLIQAYGIAGNRILELIRQLGDGPQKTQKQIILKQIYDILTELSRDAPYLAKDILEESYKDGANLAIQQLVVAEAVAGTVADSLNTSLKPLIHQEAVQAMMDETFYRILECNDNMSADAKQRIEDILKEVNQRSLIDGLSRKQATKEATAKLTESGITGIITKDGRRIPAEKYMANVIHYHQRKAHVEGVLNKMIDNNQDLVFVNKVGITCEMCAKYQGRVYSVSGNDSRFPKLDKKPPYHGHCVHSLYPWLEKHKSEDEIKYMQQESNRPFEDNRTEQNIDRYNEIQRKKSKKNETYKQWLKYKARLPDDTPDLKTFASLKARNTKTYKELQDDYRKIRQKSTLPKRMPKYKTVAEAKRALVDDIGFLEAESSLDLVDEDLLIANTNQLKKLEDKFGMIRESTGTIFAKSNGDAVAFVSNSPTNPSNQSLSLALDSFRNKEQFLATRIKMVETGYSMPLALTDAELSVATVTHEYGHILQNVLIRREMESLGWESSNQYKFLDLKKKSRTAMNKWYTDVAAKVRRQHLNEIVLIAKESDQKFDLMSNLSAYGKTNESEFFAEVFMNSQLSKPNVLGNAMNVWLERKGLIR